MYGGGGSWDTYIVCLWNTVKLSQRESSWASRLERRDRARVVRSTAVRVPNSSLYLLSELFTLTAVWGRSLHVRGVTQARRNQCCLDKSTCPSHHESLRFGIVSLRYSNQATLTHIHIRLKIPCLDKKEVGVSYGNNTDLFSLALFSSLVLRQDLRYRQHKGRGQERCLLCG